jgi:hypothetical protein
VIAPAPVLLALRYRKQVIAYCNHIASSYSTNMEGILSLDQQHPELYHHQSVSYWTIRSHPGMWFGPEDGLSPTPGISASQLMGAYKTRKFEISISLLCILRSLGCVVDLVSTSSTSIYLTYHLRSTVPGKGSQSREIRLLVC